MNWNLLLSNLVRIFGNVFNVEMSAAEGLSALEKIEPISSKSESLEKANGKVSVLETDLKKEQAETEKLKTDLQTANESLDKKMVQYYIDNIEDIYADASEDKNYAIRQYFAGNKGPLQDEVNQVAKDFINLVKPKLTGSDEQNAKVLKGGMFDEKFSKKVGLISRIGTRNVAINRILELSKYY